LNSGQNETMKYLLKYIISLSDFVPKLFEKPYIFKEQSIKITFRRNTDESSNCLYEIEHIFENGNSIDRFDDPERVELAIIKINSAIREIIGDIKDDVTEEKALNKQTKDKIIGEYREENPL
jgi:hypothetical protein